MIFGLKYYTIHVERNKVFSRQFLLTKIKHDFVQLFLCPTFYLEEAIYLLLLVNLPVRPSVIFVGQGYQSGDVRVL